MCQAPASSGSSSRTTSDWRAAVVTGRAHSSMRRARSEPWVADPTKRVPSRYARKASAISARLRGSGEAAGTSSRFAALVTMASTIPDRADCTVVRDSALGSGAATAPGRHSMRPASRSAGGEAGCHWTENSAVSGRLRLRRLRTRCRRGTVRPPATSSTAVRAAVRSHSALTPSRRSSFAPCAALSSCSLPCSDSSSVRTPLPAATSADVGAASAASPVSPLSPGRPATGPSRPTSHPKTSPTSATSASALMPPGSLMFG